MTEQKTDIRENLSSPVNGPSASKIDIEAWEKGFQVVPDQNLDKLVMEHFVSAGMAAAAVQFSEESGIKIGEDELHFLRKRSAVRDAILAGDTHKAMTLLKKLYEPFLREYGDIYVELVIMHYRETLRTSSDGTRTPSPPLHHSFPFYFY